MRIYKPKYKGKDGTTQEYQNYYIEMRHKGRLYRIKGYTDKKETQKVVDNLEELKRTVANCRLPDDRLSLWLDKGLNESLRQQLVSMGLLDSDRAAGSKAIHDQLNEFLADLKTGDITGKQVTQVYNRAKTIIDGCGFKHWTDIKPLKIKQYLADLRKDKTVEYIEKDPITKKPEKKTKIKQGISNQTSNFYLQALGQFCLWLVTNGRASMNPIAGIERLDTQVDRRHDRRALTVDEVRRLLESTKAGPFRFKMSGEARALCYRLAVETGLRANELRTLTAGDCDIATSTITIQAGYSKRRRRDVIALRPDTAVALELLIKNKLHNVRVFNVPISKASKMIQADLKDAGIEYCVNGLYADFHCLRHTTATLLAMYEPKPAVAQSVMRHSDIRLTLSRYTHINNTQEREAIMKLPDLTAPSTKADIEKTA